VVAIVAGGRPFDAAAAASAAALAAASAAASAARRQQRRRPSTLGERRAHRERQPERERKQRVVGDRWVVRGALRWSLVDQRERERASERVQGEDRDLIERGEF